MRLLRAAERVAVPWKNGGGITREVAAFPEGAGFDAFHWRISIADVAAGGPFSRFPGIDRVLTVIEGRGLVLSVEGMADVDLNERSHPFAFAGDAACDGLLLFGPIRDLNVMTRRGVCTAAVRRVLAPEEIICRAAATVLVALAPVSLGVERLAPYDAAIGMPGETLMLAGARVEAMVAEIIFP
jgi:environmental stress-induced protein Ves